MGVLLSSSEQFSLLKHADTLKECLPPFFSPYLLTDSASSYSLLHAASLVLRR